MKYFNPGLPQDVRLEHKMAVENISTLLLQQGGVYRDLSENALERVSGLALILEYQRQVCKDKDGPYAAAVKGLAERFRINDGSMLQISRYFANELAERGLTHEARQLEEKINKQIKFLSSKHEILEALKHIPEPSETSINGGIDPHNEYFHLDPTS